MSTIDPIFISRGTFVATEDLNRNFRKFSEINGKLDEANVASIDKLLDYTYIQLGAVSGGTMVGGTANLDYFNNVRYIFDRGKKWNRFMQHYDIGHLDFLSESRDLSDGLGEQEGAFTIGTQQRASEFIGVEDAVHAHGKLTKAVPGASLSFYLPYQAYVLVTWQVAWTSDAARLGNTPNKIGDGQRNIPDPEKFPEPNVAIRFFFDGGEHARDSLTRESRETMFAQAIEPERFQYDYRKNEIHKHKLRDRHKSRYWSGHAYVGIKTKGFHTTSLRVISQEIVRQTRVRARNIKVLYFKV